MADRSLLNPAQARRLLAIFTDVDQGLARVEALCAGGTSPFAQERADVAPGEARLLTSFVAAARARMVEACDRLGVKRPEPAVSGRWSVETALHFAGISFSELSPKKMRGYGVLAPEAEEELAGLAGALDALAAKGVDLVREADAPPAIVAAAIPSRAGVILREIERLTAQHGLYEVRPLLVAALERATTRTLDVGIFGRVSAGKSSLLTHVSPFSKPSDGGSGGSGARSPPENHRGVRNVLVRSPSVPEGVRFLDTPGVGSLSSSGPALAFAALPRCDLGLVLVAAGTPLGPDDIALVRGLRGAGIEAMVLLSKADLLGDQDRERSMAYLASELDRALGAGHGTEVRMVSMYTGSEPLIAALRADVLGPAARDHAIRSEAALGRRLARLVELTTEALAGHDTTLAREMKDERVRRSALDVTRSRAQVLSRSGPLLLERATSAVAAAWERGEDALPAAVDALTAAPSASVVSVRSALDAARSALGSEVHPRLPPLFDPLFLSAMPDLRPPALGRSHLGRPLAARRLAPLAEQVDAALSAYAGRLLAWAEGALAEIAREASREPGPASGAGSLAALAALAHDMEEGPPEPDVLDRRSLVAVQQEGT